MSILEETQEAFAARKAAAVAKAEAALKSAQERLEKALREYDAQIAFHEARGDGFFSRDYISARKEAVLARKAAESRTSTLNTARSQAEATTLVTVMTARKLNALTCDKEGCPEQLQALDRESAYELRIRAARDNGWRFEGAGQGFIDYCRWHA